MLDGELSYTKILEVNLFAFAYRLFHRDLFPINGTFCIGTHSFSSFIYSLSKRQKHKLLTKVENHGQKKGLSALREKLWPL